MLAIIQDKWIQLEQLPPDMHDILDNYFSITDPNIKYIEDSLEQNWDGVYHKYNRTRQRITRALLNELIICCKIHNMPLEITDSRQPSQYPIFTQEQIDPQCLHGITLLPHQIRGLQACIKHEIGIHMHKTGAGKTELMCAITKHMKCPTIIIAEERVVIDQITERLSLRKVIDDVGVFYAGRMPNDQLICVGSIASIMPPTKLPPRRSNEKSENYERKLKAFRTRVEHSQQYRQLLSKCELLMIDECDRCSGSQYRKLLKQYNKSRYVYGFTGTLPDKQKDPLQYWHLKEVLGNVISRSERKELENLGKIIPVKYISMCFGDHTQRHNRATYDIACKKWIDNNTEFHNKISELTLNLPNDNFLILVESIKLGEMLESVVLGSKFIHGQTTKKKRNETLTEFESRSLRILIGSKILKRGLDIQGGIDNVILCASSKKNAEIEQKMGRALRINKRGWARIFDFMFVCNKHLYLHSRERLKRMIELGYYTQVITSKKILDGPQVIKKGFNLFRHM